MADVLTSQVEWSLFDEGMGLLERAGLAGLYLSLRAAEEWAEENDEDAVRLKEVLLWKLSDTNVALFWEGDEVHVFTRLLEWSWQIRDGVYYMPGVHRGRDMREHFDRRIHTHSGLLGTFLKCGGKLNDPKVDEFKNFPVQIDDSPSSFFVMRYRPFLAGERIRQGKLLIGASKGKGKRICPMKDQQGNYRDITLPGWLHPGSAKRFGPKDQEWTGKTKDALLLLFAPIACFFMKLPNEKNKKMMRANWVYIVPEIHSLRLIDETHPKIQVDLQRRLDTIQTAGLGDAGLRVAAAYSGRVAQRRLKTSHYYITKMGVTDYYSSSPTVTTEIRKNVFTIKPSELSIQRYSKVFHFLPNEYKRRTAKKDQDSEEIEIKGTHWLKQPSSRGRITENLVNNKAWYMDLIHPVQYQYDSLENQRKRQEESISIERLWFQNLRYEWRGLMNLIDETVMWEREEERDFVRIMHNSLRKMLDKEIKGLGRGGSRNIYDRWEDRTEMIRRKLIRAKTLNLTRNFFVELYAEAGGSKTLSQSKEKVWYFITHPYEWQKARDLGFLALVTFTDSRLSENHSDQGDVQ
jgi:CRISPR-associated protein Cas8a1/Csx13